MDASETIDFHIRWLWLKIYRLYNVEASKFGGTISVGYALLNIDKEGTPSTKLGPKMGVEPQSLSRTLKTMEDKGLITRTPSPDDKRMVLIHLTEEGKKFRDNSRDVVTNLNKYISDNLTKKEVNSFLTVAAKISALLERPEVQSAIAIEPIITHTPNSHPHHEQ